MKTNGHLCFKKLFESVYLANSKIFGKNEQDVKSQ